MKGRLSYLASHSQGRWLSVSEVGGGYFSARIHAGMWSSISTTPTLVRS